MQAVPPPVATPWSQVRAVTFDVGGTLLFPHPSVGAIYAEVMGRHGIGFDGDTLEGAFRRAWQHTVRSARDGIDAAAERAWWRALVGNVLHDLGHRGPMDPMFDELWVTFSDPRRWRLYAGAHETLAELRARGYRLAVLSNWDDRLRPLLTGLGLVPQFEEVVISAEVGIEKPDVRLFRHVEQRLGLPPSHLLHVGDSDYHDVGGAQGAGWHCTRILHHAAAVPPASIATLADLLTWLPVRAAAAPPSPVGNSH